MHGSSSLIQADEVKARG